MNDLRPILDNSVPLSQAWSVASPYMPTGNLKIIDAITQQTMQHMGRQEQVPCILCIIKQI